MGTAYGAAIAPARIDFVNSVALFIVHRALAGQRDRVKEVWLRHMAPTIQSNPGHLAYFYSYDAQEPDTICAFQHYASEAEAAAFLKHPDYREYLQAVEPLLAGPPQIRQLQPQWVKTG